MKNNKQDMDQIECNLIGDKKWASLNHAGCDVIRNIWEDNNLVQGDNRPGGGGGGLIGGG